jgi:TRAP-type uncharacterized transport system substrate-binding protein
MFKDKANPRFDEIRALFPIPSLTMHFVMSEKSGVTDFSGMEGKTILLGKGSFGAREGEKYLKLFGLEGKVTLAEVELSNAVPALKNGQIDGFVTGWILSGTKCYRSGGIGWCKGSVLVG